jgi:hypothetical protein
MNPHDGEKSQILAGARRFWSPEAADAARVRGRLDARLAAGGAGSVGATARTWPARLLVAGAVAATAAGAGYWAGYGAGRRAVHAPMVVLSRPERAAATSAGAPAVAPLAGAPLPAIHPEAHALRPAAAPANRRDTRAPRRAPDDPPSNEGGTLTVELRALRNAERALRDGRPGLALAFLNDLDRQVPHGDLTEEREATATLARCARGDGPFGVNLGEPFTARYPTSVYRARVEQACGRTESGSSGDSPARRSGP